MEIALEIVVDNSYDIQVTTALEILRYLFWQTSLQYLPSLISPPWNLLSTHMACNLLYLSGRSSASSAHLLNVAVPYESFFFFFWVFSSHLMFSLPGEFIYLYRFIYYLYNDHSQICFNLRTLSQTPYPQSQTSPKSLLNIQCIPNLITSSSPFSPNHWHTSVPLPSHSKRNIQIIPDFSFFRIL